MKKNTTKRKKILPVTINYNRSTGGIILLPNLTILQFNLVLLVSLLLFPQFSSAFEYEYSRPKYDSGWREISQNQTITLTHNIKGDVNNYVVDLQIRADQFSSVRLKKIHNRFYGGNIRSGGIEGIVWSNLDETSIKIYRGRHDGVSQEIRLRIWYLPGANYDSGWLSLQKNGLKILRHNLQTNVDDYVVSLECKNDHYGIHNIYYGGVLDTSGPQTSYHGVQWARLTSSTITVTRMTDDDFSDQIRVRIWKVKHPDFDSGWRTVQRGQDLVLSHGINSPFNDYVVYLEFKDPDYGGAGINNVYMGGMESGTRWEGGYIKQVTGSTITLYRNIDDTVADQIRVRIWKCSAPAYDSGWVSISPGSFIDLAHGLPGTITDDYLVVMELQNPDGTIHNCFIGGTDVDTNGSLGFLRLGAYWSLLTDTSIRINREHDDGVIGFDVGDKIRIRIWIPPMADIDSGWIDPRDGQRNPIYFNLGGDPADYFVYIEGKDTSLGGKGRNIQHIGGDTYFENNTFYSSGFFWSDLTTNSVTINVGDYDLNEKIRIRIWKKGGLVEKKIVNQPTTGTYHFTFPAPSRTDYILDMQFDYNFSSGTSNRHLGKIWSQPNKIVGAYWKKTDSQHVEVSVDENWFNKIRLYSWDTGWHAQQAIPRQFPWPMFLPAIINGK